jgi:hypothetical protein
LYDLMGWFQLGSPGWSDETDTKENWARHNERLEELHRRVDELDLWTTIVELRHVNVQDYLIIFANQNHPRGTPEVIDELLAFVAANVV